MAHEVILDLVTQIINTTYRPIQAHFGTADDRPIIGLLWTRGGV